MSDLKKLESFCAYRDRCVLEVQEKMNKLAIQADDRQALLDQLMADQFIDEQRYAISFTRGKFFGRKWGRQKIKLGLMKKYISTQDIEEALLEIPEEEYLNALKTLMTKKLSELELKNADDPTAKLLRFGIQKGYEQPLVWDVIHAIVPAEL